MTIRIFIIVFALIFLAGCQSNWLDYKTGEAIVRNAKTKEATSINPLNTEFAGGRGANHLVVYTPEYGEKTNTNEWGSEAIIHNGMVVSIGENNSYIPKNGMVISGNDQASQWINKNLEVGMEINLQGKTIEYVKTENTNIERAKLIFRKAQNRIENNPDLISCQVQFEELEEAINNSFKDFVKAKKQNDINQTQTYGEDILNLAKKYYYTTFTPKEKEFRGAWIRLADKTPEQLRNTIKRMADAGFNAILPESIYNGYAIYPDAHKLLPQLPQFTGWDPMRVMEEECPKYGMQLIPWCEMFFVGGAQSPVVKQKPEWIGMFRHGSPAAVLEPGFHYLCPSRPEVHKFLLEALDNLATRYTIDGIQLDYIRYSMSEPWENGMCYCDYCHAKAQNELDIDIKEITPENKNEWQKWNHYRENNITTFVENCTNYFKKNYPKISLSADVVPDSDLSLKKKFQNWKLWVKTGLIDNVFIMSYSPDNRTIEDDTQLMMSNVSETRVKPVVGLGPFLGFQPELLLQQIEIARNHGAKGVCLFSFNALTPEQLEALKSGPFRK